MVYGELAPWLPTGPGAAGDCSDVWAASGAMALTGRADGHPLAAPPCLALGLHCVSAALTAVLPAALDVPALLGERAAIAGLHRNGDVSCGGGTRLLHASDRAVAVSLARPEDVDAVPA